MPTTYVCAESASIEDVLAAIKKGHIFVTNSPRAPKIFLTSGDAIPGDKVKFCEGMSVELSIEALKKGQTARIYHNENVIFEYTARKNEKNFSASVTVPSEGFVRADVKFTFNAIVKAGYVKVAGDRFGMHDEGEPVPDMIYSFTNPIFFVNEL